MKWYLVQHGEAVAKNVDPNRPLSARGKRDVEHMAGFLKKCGVTPDRILHSGKTRAHQTAEILAGALSIEGAAEAVSGLDPDDPVETFFTGTHTLKQDTMLVRHLPFLSRVVSYFVTGDPDRAVVAFTPGCIVCLERDAGQNWRIQWMLRPDCPGRE